MQRVSKLYPIHQSPFYKLSSKKKLASLFKISQKQMMKLIDYNEYYRDFINKKEREIQEPLGIRKIVHKRIKELLSRMNPPEYLFSGVKKKSATMNARYHLMNKHAMTLDIKSFYRSSSIEYVFRFFHYTLKMQEDIAWIISRIVCYNDFIPTGSSSSQLLAYYAYSELFNNIFAFSQKKNILFSLYVDDMTFSSLQPIPKNFDLYINELLKPVELNIKKKKTKFYFKNDSKKITGCIITNHNELKIQNKHKKKIINLLQLQNLTKTDIEKEIIKKSILGSILHIQQIEPNSFNNTKIKLERDLKKDNYNKKTA